jgi:ATP-binding cassette subfamily F protein 3
VPKSSSSAPARPTAPSPAAPAAASGNKPNAAPRDDRKAGKQARAKLADLTRPLRNEVLQIDARLARLGSEKAEAEKALASSTLAPEQIADAGRRLNHIAAEVAMLEERWLELSQQIEAMSAEA